MIAPLIGDDALAASLLAAVGIGAGFGVALERAGLGNARKLAAQFHGRDFTVLKVLFSALATAMLGVFWLGRAGWLDVTALYVPETWLWPQAAGALLFGVGLAIAGLCPGTACVAVASGRIDGAAVLLGLFAGMLAYGLLLPRSAVFHLSGARGAWTLPELGGWSPGVVVAAVVAVALLAFAVAEYIEARGR